MINGKICTLICKNKKNIIDFFFDPTFYLNLSLENQKNLNFKFTQTPELMMFSQTFFHILFLEKAIIQKDFLYQIITDLAGLASADSKAFNIYKFFTQRGIHSNLTPGLFCVEISISIKRRL